MAENPSSSLLLLIYASLSHRSSLSLSENRKTEREIRRRKKEKGKRKEREKGKWERREVKVRKYLPKTIHRRPSLGLILLFASILFKLQFCPISFYITTT
jgi:hypothetical protein